MLALAQGILAIAYPIAIVWALSRYEPRVVAGVVLATLVLRAGVAGLRRWRAAKRAGARPTVPWSLAIPVGAVGAVSATTAIANDPLGLLLAPVFVNAALLASFLLSLRRQPIVETLARLQVDRLAPAEIRYCRRVTQVWAGFFVVNGAIAFALAWSRSLDAWALYTGFLSYGLMGLLFAGEYVYRHARFRRYVGHPGDRLLARLFPPGHRPERVGVVEGPGRDARTIRLEVPTGLACWAGHFPGRPMLPGVLQVEWVLRELEAWQGEGPRLVALEGLKFKQPVLPGDALALELAADDGIGFRFLRGGEVVSQGRVRLAADVPDGSSPSSVEAAANGAPALASPPTSGAQAAARAASAGAPTGTWPEPASVLVHAPPMRWLRAIEAHDERETRCLVAVADLAGFADPAGGIGAHVALEWMAQAVAAHAGLVRRARGEAPSLGLLLGSKHVGFARPAYTRDERFRVVAVRGWGGDQGAASFDCRVESLDGREIVARARLSCFLPGDDAGIEGGRGA